MNDENIKSTHSRAKGRYMDMAVRGTRRMSPEMLAAQERLKHQNTDSRPPKPHLRAAEGPMTGKKAVSNHTASARNTAYASSEPVRATKYPQSHDPRLNPKSGLNGPVKASKRQKTHAKNALHEPTGPKDSLLELETIDFEAIGSLDTTEELAEAFLDEPAPLLDDNFSLSGDDDPFSPKNKHYEDDDPFSPQNRHYDDGPDNNKSVLGGKSPFINTLNLEKRPLSGHSVTTKKPTAPAPLEPRLTTSDTIPTVVATKRKSRKNNIALGIAIILTVILGAVVGTVVYLAFFQ